MKQSLASRNDISIIGDNVLYYNGNLFAYYILPYTNYDTNTDAGIDNAIDRVNRAISALANAQTDLQFSIIQLSKAISAADVKKNLLDTIHLYANDADLPEDFTVEKAHTHYCLLVVNINQNEMTSVEEYSIKETAKQLLGQAVAKMSGIDNKNIDFKKILAVEENVFRELRHICARASRELIFYNFASRLYPSYEIVYSDNSYFTSSRFSTVLGSLSQIVHDKFGWFELDNTGVDIFGAPAQKTYGCILRVKDFPDYILSQSFPLNYEGTSISAKCLSRREASLKLRRSRTADRYELSTALDAGAEAESTELLAEQIDLATDAAHELKTNDALTFCLFNTLILVTGSTYEELKDNIAYIVTELRNRDVLVTRSLTQAKDFLDEYVALNCKSYDSASSLEFPLSFQMNDGSNAGDGASKFASPKIGED